MSNTMFFNLLLNIGLLVLIATMLTKLPMVRSMLLEDSHAMGSRAALAVIFGLVSIFSTYTGVRAQGGHREHQGYRRAGSRSFRRSLCGNRSRRHRRSSPVSL